MKSDTLYRMGIGILGFACLCLGYFWWNGVVYHMGPQHSSDLRLKLVVASVIFIPLLLFLWLMARLIRPAK